MRVLALTPDLFFSTRIKSTLERAGHNVRVVDTADVEELEEALWSLNPALAILDIGAAGWEWEDILETLREASAELPILAFGSHMNIEATKRAQAGGATRVVAKSEFVNNMVNLAERYGQREG